MIAVSVPLFPTIYVSNPLLAKLSAWYIIRGLRPTSPRTTIATERSNGFERVLRKATAPARHRSSPRTIEEVRVFISMSQAWEMRLDDNDTKVAGGNKRHVRRASTRKIIPTPSKYRLRRGRSCSLIRCRHVQCQGLPVRQIATKTGRENDI